MTAEEYLERRTLTAEEYKGVERRRNAALTLADTVRIFEAHEEYMRNLVGRP